MKTYMDHNSKGTSYEVVEMECDAEAVLRVQRDNDALRATLARVTAERDQWRNTAQEQAIRIADLLKSLRELVKEVMS